MEKWKRVWPQKSHTAFPQSPRSYTSQHYSMCETIQGHEYQETDYCGHVEVSYHMHETVFCSALKTYICIKSIRTQTRIYTTSRTMAASGERRRDGIKEVTKVSNASNNIYI